MLNKIAGLIKRKIKIIVIGIFFSLSIASFLMASVLSYGYFYNIPNYTIIGEMPTLKKFVDAARNIPYMFYKFSSSPLPVYKLYIEPKEYQELKDALPKKANEFLSEEQRKTAPAVFVYNDARKPVKAGFRGDRSWHWFFEQKSWNIKFNALFDEYSEIKLIVPHDRGYIDASLSSYRARKFGLPVPDDKFVVLQINDGPKSFYYQQEGWTNEFLKRHFGTDNGNLYGEKGLVSPIFESSMFWKKYVTVKGQENNFADLDYFLDLIKTPDDIKFKKEIFNILDMDNFYNFQVHTILSGSLAPGRDHNMRLFFDKEKNKFFLISWNILLDDYSLFFQPPEFEETYDLDYNYNPLMTRVLNIPEFNLERNKRLWNYVKDDKNLEDDLRFYDETFEKIKAALYNDSVKFWRNAVAERWIKDQRSGLISGYHFLREQLEKVQVFAIISLKSGSRLPLYIDLQYRGASPINFNGLSISSKTLESPNSFQLYEDTNSNGVFDYEDLKVGDLRKKDNNNMFISNLNKILYSDRIDNGEDKPVSVKITRKRFFVVSGEAITIKNPSVSVDIFNEVTGSAIRPETHINE